MRVDAEYVFCSFSRGIQVFLRDGQQHKTVSRCDCAFVRVLQPPESGKDNIEMIGSRRLYELIHQRAIVRAGFQFRDQILQRIAFGRVLLCLRV